MLRNKNRCELSDNIGPIQFSGFRQSILLILQRIAKKDPVFPAKKYFCYSPVSPVKLFHNCPSAFRADRNLLLHLLPLIILLQYPGIRYGPFTLPYFCYPFRP